MKILTTNQIREADLFTIENEPVSSLNLMERAAGAIAGWFFENLPAGEQIMIFAGPGNNGGDGLALGRILKENGYSPRIYLMTSSTGYSPDTSVNLERLQAIGLKPEILTPSGELPLISHSSVVVDALFGTGLSRPLEGFPAKIIDHINASGAKVVSVDMPSGLFGDDNRENTGGSIISASHTLSFQVPKLAFMFTENERFTGRWEILPIGLHEEFLNNVKTSFHYACAETVRALIRPRRIFSHKGNLGHCLLISGSRGKMGAAVLAAESCLRTGTGLLTVHVPKEGCGIVQTAIPEAMLSIDCSENFFTELPDLDKFDAIGAGPGTGTGIKTSRALYKLITTVKVPLILDADAINIMAGNNEWIGLLPENSVLTPHPGEFDRLAGKHMNSHDRLLTQINLAKNHKITIVLKGAFTSTATPSGDVYFNGSGNPGMATAGSGDVLTGIILSLLGQGYPPADAAITGVFIHGMAGDHASSIGSEESLIARDISSSLGNAFRKLKTARS
ncbi:MAG: NAD(P)H-hydrate dehydratase [Marinilabiliales bacterium]|nr:MAG: NAD(P)H-hydrate dehydratase [Marinilabiliales bacterium]